MPNSGNLNKMVIHAPNVGWPRKNAAFSIKSCESDGKRERKANMSNAEQILELPLEQLSSSCLTTFD